MTKPDKTRHELSVEQLNAVDLLVTGQSDREVANAVGVTRQTVCGWRLHHPYFQAALNARRKEVWGRAVDRLRFMILSALDVVERSLDDERHGLRASLGVLKLAGLDASNRQVGPVGVYLVGPDEANTIMDDLVRAQRPDLVADLTDPAPTDRERHQALQEAISRSGASE